MIRRCAIALVVLAVATPALSQSPIRDRLAKLGQSDLVAGDGPTYRAATGAGEVLLLQVAGDGRATLTAQDKTGKADGRAVSNRQLDALDAALADAGFNGERPLMAEGCKPGAEIVFETIIDGRYRYAVQCEGGPLDKALALLRGK
jgi:hypothetical protein